jgi:hypothetical protein
LLLVAMAGCEPPPGSEDDAGCVISGLAAGEEVLVRHAGPSAVRVLLGPATQISVNVGRPGGPVATVRGPHIGFEADPTPMVFHARAPIASMDGLVRLDPTVPLSGLRPLDGGLVATAKALSDVTIDGVALACSAVLPGRVEEGVDELEPLAEEDDLEGPAMVTPRSDRLEVRGAPGSQQVVTFESERDPDDPDEVGRLRLQALAGDAAWTRVRWGSTHIEITGWVETRALSPASFGVTSICGFSSHCCLGADRSGVVRRRAILRAGTQLHTGPTVDPWATVHTAAEVTIEQVPGEGWGRLVDLPDVVQSCEMTAAWVRVADIP